MQLSSFVTDSCIVKGSSEIPQRGLTNCRRARCLVLGPRKVPRGRTDVSWGVLAVGQACVLEASRMSEATQSAMVFLAAEKQEAHTSRICLKHSEMNDGNTQLISRRDKADLWTV